MVTMVKALGITMDAPELRAYATKPVYEFFRTLNKFFDLCLKLSICHDRSGGYFCMSDNRGYPLLIVPLGTVPEEKASKYLEFAQEKARRLATHPEHQTSWESRDPNTQKWGGAVRDLLVPNSFIYSFSAFPEQADEAFTLSIAGCINPTIETSRKHEREGLKEAYRIAAANHNSHFPELIDMLPRGVMI